tara:strand:+ start:34545 stop:35567 length:1023 start_codon:yes stop_codon:yes gene_type:complete
MKFNSVDDIIEHFDYESLDLNTIKKRLKKRIKKVHPDENGGVFKSEEDKIKYQEIHSALEFIKNQTSNSLSVSKTDLNNLTSAINKLAKFQKEESSEEQVKVKDSELETILSSSVQSFVKKNSGLKISGIAITMAITALWSFPAIVKDHPILSVLYEHHNEFTIFWILTLLISGMLWLKIKKVENKDKDIKDSYKLESVQNQMFILFSQWHKSDYANTEFREKKHYIKFTKDDLIHFLMHNYDRLQFRLRKTPNPRARLNEIERIREIEVKRKPDNKSIFVEAMITLVSSVDFIAKPGEIDLATAQSISYLIITRLITRNLIIIQKDKTLSDTYEYEFKN